MINTLKRIFVVSRPISWINTAFPFAATYLVLGGSIDPMFAIGTLFFLIPYNVLMYGVNDVFDYESDMKNPRKGGIEGARESRQFHTAILWSSIITCLPFIAVLTALSPNTSFTLVAIVFMVVAYSIKGLRFKEKPVLDSVTSSAHFVGPMLYALALFNFPEAAWPYVVAFFLWGMASHAFGAVQDIIPDREGNLASIATIFGARATIWICVLLYLASAVIIAATGPYGYAIAITVLGYMFNCLVYRNLTDKDSASANKGWRRFIWLNMVTGFIITMTLIAAQVA